RRNQIDERVTGTRGRKQLRALRKSTRKSINHIAANFITAWTSSSANRRAHVFGLRAVLIRQTLQSGNYGRRECATPTGMNRRERTRTRVADENRNAISRLPPRQHAISVADNHVAVDRLAELILSRLGFFDRINCANVNAVHLPATGKGPLARKKLEKAA